MTSVDAMADEIMKGLTEYADLAEEGMKKAVKKTAKSVKDEISANAPKRTGTYAKSSWHTFWKRVTPSVAVDVYPVDRILPLRKRTVYSCWSS